MSYSRLIKYKLNEPISIEENYIDGVVYISKLYGGGEYASYYEIFYEETMLSTLNKRDFDELLNLNILEKI
jgi:hypothetical protein